MKLALYGNGMIGGDDLTREVEGIHERADQLRAGVTGADLIEVEAEFDTEGPFPATAEAEPVGA